ncbi:hypothetical protein Tco_0445557 [Tanacetum coccineum]
MPQGSNRKDPRAQMVEVWCVKISASGEAHSSNISPEDLLGVFSATKILADAGKSDTVPKIVSEVQTYTRRRRDVNTGSKAVNTASIFLVLLKRLLIMLLDERVEVVAKINQAHDIDWGDPAVLRYQALQNRSFSVAEVRKNMCTYLKNQEGNKQSHFKGISYEDIRPIFESVWDQNHAFVPKDSEIEKEIVQQEDVVAEQVVKESSKKVGGRLKRKVAKVNWKSYCKGDVGYYEIHRANGIYKTYIYFSEMLNDFDKEDLIVLYRLFNEKYASTRPGFDDLVLLGDMKIMFETDGDDAV